MTTRIDFGVEMQDVEVVIHIEDRTPDDLFTRAEAAEFQAALYGDAVKDKETVLAHWAYNAIFNNVQDASRLDGWGDLERGMVEFRVIPGGTQPTTVYDVQEVKV
jgi:hypothetical protein